MKYYFLIAAIWIFIIGLSLLVFIASGCNSGWTWPGQKPDTVTSAPPPATQLWQTVKKSNWLTTLAIPIIALGAVAMFNGAGKLGMSAIIFGCVNLFMALATARFALWMGIFGLIGSATAVAVSILTRRKAIVDMIKGIQVLKNNPTINPDDANRMLADKQSPSTQKIVQAVKTKLKLKKEI